jgi:hypothetical protein
MGLEHFDERPYVQKIENIGPISVWLFDGVWARKYLHREITNFAEGRNPMFRSFIPRDEFWIERGTDPSEWPYFIDRMMEEWWMLAKGFSFKRAEEAGQRIEVSERGRAGERVTKRELLEGKAEISKLGKSPDLEIYLVDGKIVRGYPPAARFCHGGHDLVYGYVPDRHAWVDGTAPKADWSKIACHEVGERNDMNMGQEYAPAHKKRSRIEYQSRWDPQETVRQMKELGVEWYAD